MKISKEYKVVKESALGSLFLGTIRLLASKIEDVLNEYAKKV